MGNKVEIVIACVDYVSKKIESITGKLRLMDRETVQASKSMGLALAGAGAAIGGLGLSMTRAAARFEQSEIAFSTMLGSMDAGKKLLADLTDFAKRTPFELSGLEQTTKQLLAYGIEQDKVLDDLRSLGNIASGVGMDRLPNLTLAFGQVKAATRLTGMELRQFTEAGVPLLDALSKSMGATVPEIQKMVSAGKVGFEEVRKALESLSSGTGRFAGLMEKQAESLSGKWSNLADSWDIFLREEGKALLDWGKKLVDWAIHLVNNVFPKVIESIKSVVNWFAEHKIALGALAGAITGILMPAIVDLGKKLLGMVAATGPIGLFGAAVGAIVMAVQALDDAFGTGGLAGVMEEMADVANNNLNPALEELFGQVSAGSRLMMEHNGAWDELAEIVPNAMAAVTDQATEYRKAIKELSETLLRELVPAALSAVAAMSGFMGGAGAAMVEAALERITQATKRVKKTFDDTKVAAGGMRDSVAETAASMAESMSAFAARAKEQVIDLKNTTSEIMASTATDLQNKFTQVIEMTQAATEQALIEWEARWGGFISTMVGVQQMITDVWVAFRQGVGDSVAAAIVEGKSLGAALQTVFKNIAMHVISTLVQMGVERLALALVYGTANLQEATQRMATLAAETYAGAFASSVGIPVIGPLIAPGIAAEAVAAMLAGASAAGTAGAGVGAAVGALHGGLESVPAESTYLLQRGERVLSPRQNRDLTEFMDGGGGVVVETLNIMPGSSIDEALFDKPAAWWADLAKEKILPALNVLGRRNYGTSLAYDSEAV